MLDLTKQTVVLNDIHDVIEYMDAFFDGKIPGFPKGLSPEQVASLLDHDGTVGRRKPWDNTDTSLSDDERDNVGGFVKKTAWSVIVTSRDIEKIKFYYNDQHADSAEPLPPEHFAVAGSGGYAVVQGIAKAEEDFLVPIVDANGVPYKQSMIKKGVLATWWISKKMAEKFREASVDKRRLMAANLLGKIPNDQRVKELQVCADRLLKKRQRYLDKAARKEKTRTIKLKIDPGIKDRTGYLDIKLPTPKYQAVMWILGNLKKLGFKKPKAILCAGDTLPDRDIFKAAQDAGYLVLPVCVDTHIKNPEQDGWRVVCPDIKTFHYMMMYIHNPEKVREIAKEALFSNSTHPDNAPGVLIPKKLAHN